MALEYLQNTTPFLHNVTTKPSPKDESMTLTGTENPRDRRHSASRQRLGLLAPIAFVLNASASLVNSAVLQVRDGLGEENRISARQEEERKQILHVRLRSARDVEEWKATAVELDRLCGLESWKADADSGNYDSKLITERLADLDEARISCDVNRMLYLVRTALTRDLAGMGNADLYKHTYIGTKDLIERYIDSTVETIRALVNISQKQLPSGLDPKTILDQVLMARQAFGRSALLLSGGATFGMNHVGVLKALYDAHLLPRIISGASAGSIVCAVLCTRTDEEIPDVLRAFPHGDLAVFEEDGREDGLLQRVGRFLTQGAWIDIKHLIRVMQELLGDMTFQEAYNRTRRILNICVSSASLYELPRLLNYVTSPNVMIWSAVAASCSVPLLFSAAHLLVKNPLTGEHTPWNPKPQRWIDGSVDGDLPMTRLAEMFNVNHFIVSQVNPHVVPFLAKDDVNLPAPAQTSTSTLSDWAYTLSSLAKSEALHRMNVMADLGIFPNLVTKARSVLSQKYSGDITILPEISYRDFPRMLKNPTAQFMLDALLKGERATWPKLSRIRNHCAVELELDAAVQKLRARVVFSPSQVDLRRLRSATTGDSPSRMLGSVARTRRVSGGSLQALSSTQEKSDDEDQGTFLRRNISKPRMRSSSNHWTRQEKKYFVPASDPNTPLSITNKPVDVSLTARSPVATLSTSYSSNNIDPATAPAISSRPTAGSEPDMRHNPPLSTPPRKAHTIPLYIQLPDPDETEVTEGFGFYGSSDGDVDSQSPESSPEPENGSFSLSISTASANFNPHKKVATKLQPSPAVFTSPTITKSGSNTPFPSFGTASNPSYFNLASLAKVNATLPPSGALDSVPTSPLMERRKSVFELGGPLEEEAPQKDTPMDGETELDIKRRGSKETKGMSSPEKRYKRLFHGDA